MRLRRTVASRLLVSAAALLVVAAGAGFAEARTDDRHKPVIFIHGSDWVAPYGVSCAASFGLMKQRFRDVGHTGRLVAVGYYGHDYNCDAAIGHHGSHAMHYASGHDSANGHTGNADIRHLAYHLAW